MGHRVQKMFKKSTIAPNAPYGLGISKNEIWVKFEKKIFGGKISDFFKNFQDFPYDFTVIYPKITWAIIGHVNFWNFLNPYTPWVLKKYDWNHHSPPYGHQVTLCVAR